MQIKTPLVITETADKFDILATVAGGGVSGQAGAVRLGIARALVEYNGDLRKALKTEGLLTRDARAKERKKYGMAGASKSLPLKKQKTQGGGRTPSGRARRKKSLAARPRRKRWER